MDSIARTQKQLGAILRRQRKTLGETQATIASRIGNRQATVSDLEAGTRDTRLQTLFDVLAALDMELLVRPRTRGEARNLETIF